MLRHARVEAGDEGELSMVTLAGESADRMEKLIDRIVEISGLPGGLTPDEQIIGQLYT